MAKLVDVLAMLVRKNFGHIVIGKSRDLRFVGRTIAEAYETEEADPRTKGEFGSESGDHGALVVFQVKPDGSKPATWIHERTLPDGTPF